MLSRNYNGIMMTHILNDFIIITRFRVALFKVFKDKTMFCFTGQIFLLFGLLLTLQNTTSYNNSNKIGCGCMQYIYI